MSPMVEIFLYYLLMICNCDSTGNDTEVSLWALELLGLEVVQYMCFVPNRGWVRTEAKGTLLWELRSGSEPGLPGDASSTNLAGLLKGLAQACWYSLCEAGGHKWEYALKFSQIKNLLGSKMYGGILDFLDQAIDVSSI